MYRKTSFPKSSLPRFLKIIHPEPNERERIISALKNISADALVCQGCGKCGCMKPHGTYQRGITYEQNGELVDDFVMIPVFYCTECNYLHAFLTDFLIPFCSFTLLFILGVLKAYLERPRAVTVHAICTRYQISSTTLYAWKKRFLCHYTELMES
ncbi:MAG: helix-turn-helix domain-containing protein, partial [Lachnospiraceae bacterium]|nr:helix-turn-helix domain-containing protein [Lachnospiraceae bacterium]